MQNISERMLIFKEELLNIWNKDSIHTNDIKLYSQSEGKKYIKVLQTNYGQTSVYCFIDKLNGDILKAASFNAPAQHARGNIFNENSTKGCGMYSPDYLK